MIHKLLLIVILLLLSGNSMSSDQALKCGVNSWYSEQVMLHGDENTYFQKVFHRIKETGVLNTDQKDYLSLECLASSGNTWALMFLGSVNEFIDGKESFKFYTKLLDRISKNDQSARLIHTIGIVRRLMYEDEKDVTQVVNSEKMIQAAGEWLKSSRAHNYVLAARLHFVVYRSNKSILNAYSEAYVELNKLVAEGFDDAKPFYDKLIAVMPEDKFERAKNHLNKYRLKYSDAEWKEVRCMELCGNI